jgi:hypothetical protein
MALLLVFNVLLEFSKFDHFQNKDVNFISFKVVVVVVEFSFSGISFVSKNGKEHIGVSSASVAISGNN